MTSYKSISLVNGSFNEVDKIIINNVVAFYSRDPKYIKCLKSIINGESSMSIRVIDYFVTNYSKKYNISYRIKVDGAISEFNVHSEYEDQLNGYSKLYLDPFCRQKKVIYAYESKDKSYAITLCSSIGQLYFFSWAIRYKILEYVRRHHEEIHRDMKLAFKASEEAKKLSSQLMEEDSETESSSSEDDDFIDSSDSVTITLAPPTKKTRPKPRKRQPIVKSLYDQCVKFSQNLQVTFD